MNIPVYPRGSGTSFTGSARAPYKGIVLSTSRMNSIHVDVDYGYFECGPGATVQAVDLALAKKGYFLPVYPGSKVVATMGGMMAGNTSGHIIDACIGKPADYVLGLRVVLPTGEIMETGSKGQRKPAGTDLTKFFVGNDGLTGVVTQIRMRLVPEREKAFGIAYFKDAESVARAVVRMYRKKHRPRCLWSSWTKPPRRSDSSMPGCRFRRDARFFSLPLVQTKRLLLKTQTSFSM